MGRGERLLQTLPDRWREVRRAGQASARGAGATCQCWGPWHSPLGPPPAPTEAAPGGPQPCCKQRGLSQGVRPWAGHALPFRPPPWPSIELSMPPSSLRSGAIRHWGGTAAG